MAYIEIEKTPNNYLYPRIKDSRTVACEEVIKELTQETTLTASDVKAVLAGLSGVLVKHLREGDRVRLDELGEFYLTLCLEDGAGNVDEKEIHPSDVHFKQLHFLADRRLTRQFSDFRLSRKKGYSKGKSNPDLAQRQEMLTGLFAAYPYVTALLYSRYTGVSVYRARKDLEYYLEKGIVRLERMNKSCFYYPAGGY